MLLRVTSGCEVNALSNKADFERLLGIRAQVRSAHFSLHHLRGEPTPPAKRAQSAVLAELSTGVEPTCPQPVDDTLATVWFGCIVPKRHARRAVTRSLFKRQMRAAFCRHRQALAAGLWLVRLRAPFPVADFISACSVKLSRAARAELDGLFNGNPAALRLRQPNSRS